MFKEKRYIRNLDIENTLLSQTYGFAALGILLSLFIYLMIYINPLLRVFVYKHSFAILILHLITNVVISQTLNFLINMISFQTALGLYLLQVTMTAISAFIIGSHYTNASVFSIFLTTFTIFSVASLYGHYTKKNLIKYENIILLGFITIGILSLIAIIFSFINIRYFYALSYFESLLTVPFITFVVTNNAQKIRLLNENINITEENKENSAKISIILALTLYLEFVLIFMHLLRLLGSRKDRR
jgi:FtsH-binding integral membrane protein